MTAPLRLHCAGWLLVAGSAAGAQGTSTVVGVVRDSGGAPVGVATVTASRAQALSDSAGRFVLDRLPAGSVTVRVRRLGFQPSEHHLELVAGRRDSLFVTLVALPTELPGVSTTAQSRLRAYLSDYYRHKESGVGRFYEREQIVAMRVMQLSDLLRRVPGVRVTPDRNGRYVIRMGRSIRNCPPDFWVDNVRAHALNADDIPLSDIEALEVYAGPAGLPPEFISRFGNPSCGAVVIWTRMPG
jgi:hypothetical protein